MKKIIIVLMLVIASFLIGCEPEPVILECKPPLIPKGDGCCLDADENGICDIDEQPEIEEEEEKEEPEQVTEEEAEPEEAEEAPEEEQLEPKNTKEEAEKIGKLFAERWQLKQYNTMYVLFTPGLKEKKTATEFTAIMELDPFYKKIDTVDFNGVTMLGDKKAELDITVHTNVQDIDIPGATLEFIEGEWKVNIFIDVFELSLYDAACSGYRYNKQYRMSDCAFDLAKKVKDATYCNISACHYVECLKALGKPAGMTQETEQCYFCQPVGKTINQCILDVAIKHDKISACNIMDDEKYNDKYCVCYGGFAKHKGTAGYCNMIDNPDYRDLCVKGYEGGYC